MLEKRNLKKGLVLTAAFLAFGFLSVPEASAQTCAAGSYLVPQADGTSKCVAQDALTQEQWEDLAAELQKEIDKERKRLEALEKENKSGGDALTGMLDLLKKLLEQEKPSEEGGNGGGGDLLGKLGQSLISSATAAAQGRMTNVGAGRGALTSDNVLNTNLENSSNLLSRQLDSVTQSLDDLYATLGFIGDAGVTGMAWTMPGVQLNSAESYAISFFPSGQEEFEITPKDIEAPLYLQKKIDDQEDGKGLFKKTNLEENDAEDASKKRFVKLGLVSRALTSWLARGWNTQAKNAVDPSVFSMSAVNALATTERRKIIANSKIELETMKFLMQVSATNAGLAEIKSTRLLYEDGRM